MKKRRKNWAIILICTVSVQGDWSKTVSMKGQFKKRLVGNFYFKLFE
jgi:hypothetical protein